MSFSGLNFQYDPTAAALRRKEIEENVRRRALRIFRQNGEGRPKYLELGFEFEGNYKYRVERVAACYDVGRVVNPGLIEGQTYGGIVQGLGTGMMEELVVDRASGRVVNASLMDYKIPSTEDLPPEIVVSYIETAQADGPMGARGIGEHTMIPTPAALANAIFDACGIRITALPITAEKVLAALKRRKEASGQATESAASAQVKGAGQ